MKIALLVRGFHFLWKDRFGFPLDGRRYADSLYASVVDPLRRENEVDIFLTTYDSPILKDITTKFQPRAVVLSDPKLSSQQSTYLEGLNLIEKQETKYDRLLVTRFDLEYLKPIDEWNFSRAKRGIFFLWREYLAAWNAEHYVGDAIHMIDAEYLPVFHRGVEGLPFKNDLHQLYAKLLPITPDLYFMEEGHFDSNTMYCNPECSNPIYRIGNRPRLPVRQPWHFGIKYRPYNTWERLYARWATLFVRPAAWFARLSFRPGVSAS
jgi:hypothetical protein